MHHCHSSSSEAAWACCEMQWKLKRQQAAVLPALPSLFRRLPKAARFRTSDCSGSLSIFTWPRVLPNNLQFMVFSA